MKQKAKSMRGKGVILKLGFIKINLNISKNT